MLSEKDILPTDGNGNFFWNISNTPRLNRATAPVYDSRSLYWSHVTTKYLLPTQSPRLYNPERVAHYLNNDTVRSIAYALPFGYLCALIDGHHKACAAAFQKKPVKTLVIEPPMGLSCPHETNGMKGFLYFSEGKVYEDELREDFKKVEQSFASGVRLTDQETALYLSNINSEFDNVSWPADLLDTAKLYYDVYTHACIEWVGNLSDERIGRILRKEEVLDDVELIHIASALYGLNNPRFTEFAIFLGRAVKFFGSFLLLPNSIKKKQTFLFCLLFLCAYTQT